MNLYSKENTEKASRGLSGRARRSGMTEAPSPLSLWARGMQKAQRDDARVPSLSLPRARAPERAPLRRAGAAQENEDKAGSKSDSPGAGSKGVAGASARAGGAGAPTARAG